MKMDLKSIADCPAFQVGLQAGEFEPVKEMKAGSFYLFRGFHSALPRSPRPPIPYIDITFSPFTLHSTTAELQYTTGTW